MDKLTFIDSNLVGLESIARVNQTDEALPAQHAAEIVGDAQVDNTSAVFDAPLTDQLMHALYTPSLPEKFLVTAAGFGAARLDVFDKLDVMAEKGDATSKEVMRQLRSTIAANENFWEKFVELRKP